MENGYFSWPLFLISPDVQTAFQIYITHVYHLFKLFLDFGVWYKDAFLILVLAEAAVRKANIVLIFHQCLVTVTFAPEYTHYHAECAVFQGSNFENTHLTLIYSKASQLLFICVEHN